MTGEKQNQTGSEVCTIRIIFPVDSDEQAIDIKRKIAEIIKDIPDAQTQFSLMTAPLRLNKNA